MGTLYKKLNDYVNEDYYPYHMPGHKRQAWGNMPHELLKTDITEIDGFDNLHQAEGILRELQEQAAKLYGADESFYLVNGSTCGILSAISAAVPYGGHILMARNSHKSAYHAAYLKNLTISYLYPKLIQEYDICDVITPKQVKEALEEQKNVDAVFLVSPTYEGRIADIEEIAKIVHQKGIPLIVDEAHGAHLGLAEEFPQNSCRLGADLVIHSVHKTLPAMTQTALLHANGNRINRNQLKRYLHIYQSSSPSYVLMASIDNALQLVEKQGRELFAEFRRNYLDMLTKLKSCRCLQFVDWDEKKQDVGKLVISGKKIGLCGQQIYDILLRDYHLQLEMAAGSYCLAMFTIGDTKEAYQRMLKALLEIDKALSEGTIRSIHMEKVQNGTIFPVQYQQTNENTFSETNSKSIPLSLSWDMECELVPLETAVNRHVGEFINLYPPGIPLLVPGEVLTSEQYQQIMCYMENGLNVQGVEQTFPYRVNVLR